MPGQVPETMAELCEKSVVIVEASTTRTLPPRETSPGSLETDAVLSVRTVLKGPVVNGQQIVVAQRGGETLVFSVIPAQYPLLQPGVQYLLFLSEDRRPNSPPITGMKDI